ncbi:MAG: type IV toxin-antitoxin system AbiEi family antitoxin domain-containing protein [Prevotellaceae bacterium]|nr:type IV toxin-antitoxin system AbiEi family antitoxin domain-containing protein [Prevotellaceae bacterium]
MTSLVVIPIYMAEQAEHDWLKMLNLSEISLTNLPDIFIGIDFIY